MPELGPFREAQPRAGVRRVECPLLCLRGRRTGLARKPGGEAIEAAYQGRAERCTNAKCDGDGSRRRSRGRGAAKPSRSGKPCALGDVGPIRMEPGGKPTLQLGAQDLVDVDHCLTSSSLLRRVPCAKLSVADTVPTSIPSTSAIP